jgi:Isopropylmalate/homocitrate/citramalate synthases
MMEAAKMELEKGRVFIFDTTLRDGEQSPGFSMNLNEKLRFARQLEKLGVDIIEAGFPVASDGDFASVQQIAGEIRGAQIAALARTNLADIDRAWEAIKDAANPRIHTFISSSDIHLERQLRKTRDQVLKEACAAVEHARIYTKNVEFSPMDATRTDRSYLCEIVEAVIGAGASTVNIPDTVGYAVPDEFGELIEYLFKT